jgi:phage shock protein PspC (stress-responsive transcriptional regulator)
MVRRVTGPLPVLGEYGEHLLGSPVAQVPTRTIRPGSAGERPEPVPWARPTAARRVLRRPPSRVERSRTDRGLGGVCEGIARSIGVSPMLVRIATLLIGLVSAGTAMFAYLVAWVLLPQAADEAQPQRRSPVSAPPGSAKEAWDGRKRRAEVLGTAAAPGRAAGRPRHIRAGDPPSRRWTRR